MPRAPGHKLCSTNTGRASALQTCVVDSCSNCSDVIVLAASVAAEHLDSLYGAVSSWYTIGTSPDTLYGLCSCLYTSKDSPGRRVYHKTCLAVPSCWYVPWYACGIPQSRIRHTKPPPEFVVGRIIAWDCAWALLKVQSNKIYQLLNPTLMRIPLLYLDASRCHKSQIDIDALRSTLRSLSGI